MLKKALLLFGWGTILSTTIYESREGLELINTLAEMSKGSSELIKSEIKTLSLSILTGFFQGVGIGLICLFAASKVEKEEQA